MKIDPENALAAILIFMIAGCGMSCQWFIVFFIRKLPSLQNPFGWLNAAQSFGEAIHLTIFTFFVAPMVFFDAQWMMDISRHFGHVLLICYDICIYHHFFIALNRFCAIVFPVKYEKVYSPRNTAIFSIVSFTAAIVPTFYFYLYEDCHFYYVNDFWHFVFTVNDICNFITWYTDFMKYVSVVIIIVLIDLVTLAKVHFMNQAVIEHGGTDQIRERTRRTEINFLKQACLEAFVFVCELLTYFVIINYAQGRWLRFFLSTIAWILVHTIDGVITISFNREFRSLVSNVLKFRFEISVSNRVNTLGETASKTSKAEQ